MKSAKRVLFVLLLSAIPSAATFNAFAKISPTPAPAATLVEMTAEQTKDIQVGIIDNIWEDKQTVENVIVELLEMTQEQIDFDNEPSETADEMIPLNPALRVDNVPTEFWNLTGKPYMANFNTGSYITSTYTNYYFNPNSSGIIWVPIDTLKAYDITITCYEVGSNKNVASWSGEVPQANMNFKFSGLSATKNYYFKFTCGIMDGITGTCKINNN